MGKQNVQAKKVYSGDSAFVALPKIPLFFSFKCLPCRLDHPCQFSSVVNSDLLRTTLAWAGILIFTYSSTVKPVLSRPETFSLNYCKTDPYYAVTCIKWSCSPFPRSQQITGMFYCLHLYRPLSSSHHCCA